jgi:DNA-binding protein HU-beta
MIGCDIPKQYKKFSRSKRRKFIMNKKELIKSVVEATGLSKKDVTAIVDSVFDTITSALSQGQDVKISGFGTFKIKERAARKARNPQTGEEILIPENKVPAFKPAKSLRDAVK